MAVAALMLSACTTVVTGSAVRAPDHAPGTSAASHSAAARNLLLQTGDSTPLGPAKAETVGDSYFTGARPSECVPAVVFKGSPLPPAGASDTAESSYTFDGPARYAESINLYDKAVNVLAMMRNGLRAVSNCHGDATAVSPAGDFGPMRLGYFAIPRDGVLVWTMTRPNWTCDYGLVAVPRATLMLSACDTKTGFPMADWAAKRRAQLNSRAV